MPAGLLASVWNAASVPVTVNRVIKLKEISLRFVLLMMAGPLHPAFLERAEWLMPRAYNRGILAIYFESL